MPALSVVRAGGGGLDFHARVFSGGGEGFLEGSVAGDAPGEGDEGVAVFLRGVDCFFDEGVEDGFLERGADVGEVGLGFFDLLELVEDGGFEAGEGEVEGGVFKDGTGEAVGFGVTLAGVLFDFGAAGVGELEHAADFVEGFACGVVDGSPNKVVLAVGRDSDEHGVTAGDDEAEVRGDLAEF
ncbi:MAG: hypothetical protein ACJAQT_001767 [Akkermansiaceae bacterium]|jgi:hypothetical protein